MQNIWLIARVSWIASSLEQLINKLLHCNQQAGIWGNSCETHKLITLISRAPNGDVGKLMKGIIHNTYPQTVLNKHCFCKDGVTLLLRATNYKTKLKKKKKRLSKLVSLIHTHVAPKKPMQTFVNNGDNKYIHIVTVFAIKKGSFITSVWPEAYVVSFR